MEFDMNTGSQVRKPMAQAADLLKRALSARAGRQRGYQWVESVRRALAALIADLRKHRARAEAPRGLFATLTSPHRETVPTLDRRVENFRRDLISLMDQADSLYLRVRVARDDEAPGIVRDCSIFLRHLDEYLETETKMLLDSLNTVVGVGD